MLFLSVERCILRCLLNAICEYPQHSAPFHVPCRADAKQDYERLGLGTPPTLLRQNSQGRLPNSTGRHTDDDGSLRRRAVKVGRKSLYWKLSQVVFLDFSLF